VKPSRCDPTFQYADDELVFMNSLPSVFGLVPQSGSTNSLLDVLILLSLVFHVFQMTRQGLWEKGMAETIETSEKRYNDRAQQLRSFEVENNPISFKAKVDVKGKNEHYLTFKKDDVIRMISRGGAKSIGELNGVRGIFDVSCTEPVFQQTTSLSDDEDDEEKTETEILMMEGGKTNAEKKKEEKETKKETGNENEDGKGKGKVAAFLGKTFHPFKQFYHNLIYSNASVGKDYYMEMLMIELLSLALLVLVGPEITGSSGNILQYYKENYLPTAYVVLLFGQFMVIVVDRIIFVCRSIVWKMILQYVTLIVFNVLFIWVLPLWSSQQEGNIYESGSGFLMNTDLLILFAVKCLYWYVSARQIKDGYPVVSDDSMPSGILLKVYLSVPFVFEVCTLLEWVFTPTALSLTNYIKGEDIYANLVTCGIGESGRAHKGKDRSLYEKIIFGVILFVSLIVLWIPLFLLSSAGGIKVVPITSGTLDVGFKGYPPIFHRTIQPEYFQNVTDPDFNNLKKSNLYTLGSDVKPSNLQLVNIPNYSESFWELTPMVFDELMDKIIDPPSLTIETKLTLHRRSATNDNIEFIYSQTHEMVEPYDIHRKALFNFVDNIRSHSNSTKPLLVPAILPRMIKMPGITGSPELGIKSYDSKNDVMYRDMYPNRTVNCNFEFNCTDDGCFWTLNQREQDHFIDTGIQLLLWNIPVAEEGNVLSLVLSKGLVGLYVLLVLELFNFVRPRTRDWSNRVIFTEIPDASRLVRLCKDIVLARKDGDLLLEEELLN